MLRSRLCWRVDLKEYMEDAEQAARVAPLLARGFKASGGKKLKAGGLVAPLLARGFKEHRRNMDRLTEKSRLCWRVYQ